MRNDCRLFSGVTLRKSDLSPLRLQIMACAWPYDAQSSLGPRFFKCTNDQYIVQVPYLLIDLQDITSLPYRGCDSGCIEQKSPFVPKKLTV